MKKIDEKELHDLFAEFKNNNQAAYNELYKKYYSLVYGIAFSVMKNKEDSEDIVNEVFTKIYKIDKEKLPVSGESSWLFTVTRNECFSTIRKAKQNVSIDEIYEVPSKSQEIEEIIDIDYYNKIISKLSEQEKTIVSLKILSNFTFSKISQIMGIPIGTVQWKYYKAMNSLKISISGLAGATIAFMIVFLRREKIMREQPYKASNNKEEANKSTNIDNVSDEYNAIAQEGASQSSSKAALSDAEPGKVQESATAPQEVQNELNNSQVETNQTENNQAETNQNEETTTNVQVESTPNIENKKGLDNFSVAGITIGIACLIIFTIFFTKYQQKLNKKSSK